MDRRASGIERVTAELFSPDALFPLKSEAVLAGSGRFAIVAAQMLALPLRAIRNPRDVFVFPGYPPSPFFSMTPERSVLYVHDLFLLTRREHLNVAAKYYMTPMSKIAIRRFKYFLTNSEDTARKLRLHCSPGASVIPYRPRARNVFDLKVGDRRQRPARPAKLRVVALGTIEPRKNFVAAAEICSALANRLGCAVDLHIIGRHGWGSDARALADRSNVVLHGFLTDADAREVLNASDVYLCTSHEEGLCLPLLEMQYGGLAVVAPDDPVFREVLGSSGIFIEPAKPERSAELIEQALAKPDWRALHASASASNIERWGRLAESDRQVVLGFFESITSTRSGDSYSQAPMARDIGSGSAISVSQMEASENAPTRRDETEAARELEPAALASPALAVVDGQPINVSGIADAVDRITERLDQPASFLVCTVNLDHLVKRRQNPDFHRAYQKAEIASADGFPIAALARLDGVEIRRAPGSDLVMPLCAQAAAQKHPVFLIGTTFRALCLSASRLVAAHPGLEICGVYAPPTGFDSYSKAADEAIAVIRESGARICFVALGAPRQEMFAARAIEETRNIAFVAIGGGLDFLAGTQIRCPRIVRRFYLEWAWRLMLNPRRLGVRYFRCAMLLLALLLQAKTNRRPLAAS